MMAEDPEPVLADSAEQWLLRARQLVPAAVESARAAPGFPGRWKAIVSKLERVPACLSDLSSHPCFSKNALCRELLQSVAATLAETVDLAARGADPAALGKLQMQSDLDAVSGKLDLNLRDCALLVKAGVLLGDAAAAPSLQQQQPLSPPPHQSVRELLVRLQIGHAEAKHRAVDDEFMEMLLLDGCFVLEFIIKWSQGDDDIVCRGGARDLMRMMGILREEKEKKE